MALEDNKKTFRKSKNRRNKIHLVFDEEKRREFLTGFHKRKLQRKKEAKDKFEKELKDERKRIKAEAKESYKKLVVSHRPIPELENLTNEEYQDADVTVKVVELSTNDIVQKNYWIGANQPKYDPEEESEKEESEEEEILGMELKRKPKPAKEKTEKIKFQTEKDVKIALKKQATKTIKKSKVFQMKNKLERLKQKKKSLQMKKLKFQDKKLKKQRGPRGRKAERTRARD